MSENMSMGELLAAYSTNERISKGDIIEGEIIGVNSDEVIVNIGFMADGIVPKSEQSDMTYEVGQKVKVMVLKTDDGEGNVKLSIAKADALMVWDELQTLMNDRATFEVKVKEVVNGGVIGYYKSARIFIPASQLSLQYVEDLNAYKGAVLKVKLHEYNRDKQKCVASHKDILKVKAAESKMRQISALNIGDELTGQVIRIVDYGAFVDVGGVDGLIHISQMSWRRVKHPSEVLKVGDQVNVSVLAIDREKEKVSLKLMTVEENPWEDIYSNYQVDDLVEGTVVRIMPFGAFVEIQTGLEGLVHISELSEHHVNKVTEVLKLGDQSTFRIIDIDPEKEKIALSLKAVEEILEEVYEPQDEPAQTSTLSDLWGDKLKNLKF